MKTIELMVGDWVLLNGKAKTVHGFIFKTKKDYEELFI